jgi:epsilon-lactone hydrolase
LFFRRNIIMSATTHPNNRSVRHPLRPEDKAAMTAMRTIVLPHKGQLQGTAAREPFNAIMNRVSPPADVTYAADTVGSVSGWWCKPDAARSGEVILHLHGGWFNWGSAEAYRNFVGQVAARVGVAAFIPDYRLAPEHPFPAAPEDARACLLGLVDRGFQRIAVTGDSAGGNLALGLLPFAANQTPNRAAIVAAVALSPVTDLTLSGASWQSRAEADPYFVKSQAEALVHSYLGNQDPSLPAASPLFGDLTGLPPVRVYVGDDEMLLDDSLRYIERAVSAGVDARVDIWEGMPHGFQSGNFTAATEALNSFAAFLTGRLAAPNR